MMQSDLVSISKFLSLVLRHRPDLVGLELLPGGWVPVEALLEAADFAGRPISWQELEQVVLLNDKQRFAFSADGSLIRANQGHSHPVSMDLRESVPPDILYHGTSLDALPGIRQEGLKRMRRQHVHLSWGADAARMVGLRHGSPVVLTVKSGAMHAAGMLFYLSVNGIWLTESVPTAYLEIPDPVQREQVAAREKDT